jgi:hypothetical protein
VADAPYREELAVRWTGTSPPAGAPPFDVHPGGGEGAGAATSKDLEGAPVLPIRVGPVSGWHGTDRGLLRRSSALERAAGEPAWRYYAGRRWLPDDRVTALATDGRDGIWARTETGSAHILVRHMTLEEKAREFEERVRRRHVRHGLVAPARLIRPGDLESAVVRPDDNDGLWTAMYAAAEAFRFAATGSEEARRFAREAYRALERLQTVSGVPGLPARSIAEPDEPTGDDGVWRSSPDGSLLWKGDTSSDELVGHFFAAGVYHDLAADEAERESIRRKIGAILDRIIEGGWYLVDVTGKPTTWGVWAPEKLNGDPAWRDERGLNSLEILSFLAVGERLTGRPKYREAARELIERHGFAANTIGQKIAEPPGAVNHSDDELAFLSYYNLLRYESDRELRRTYLESLARSFRIEAPEKNPLWTFIAAAGGLPEAGAEAEGRPALEAAVRTLRSTPSDMVEWQVENEGRLDIVRAPTPNRFGQAIAAAPLHPAERPWLKYNSDPYLLDGGSGGREEDDGAFFLLAYWMGRYHGFIEALGFRL